MNKWKFLVLTIIMIPILHWNHQKADRERFSDITISERYYTPDPQVTKAISLGQQLLLGDLLWIRTILIFSDFAFDCEEEQGTWLMNMFLTISELDPSWRSIYYHGGNIMEACDSHENSDLLYELGHKNVPEDFFFPAMLGTTALTEYKDYKKAEEWFRIASEMPKAPKWYKSLVAEMKSREAGGEVAIRYLQNELGRTSDPKAQKSIQNKIIRMLHEQYMEEIAEIQKQKEEELGRKIRSLSEINIPMPDPFGEGWELAQDGVIRSRSENRLVEKRKLRTERLMLNGK